MRDEDKSRQQLIEEIGDLRNELSVLRSSENRQSQEPAEPNDRMSEQLVLFQAFAEASGQGFGMSDMDGRITYVNPALAALVEEKNTTNAIGREVTEYYPDDQSLGDWEQERFPVISRVGYWQGEVTLRSLSGELIPVLQTSFTVADKSGKPCRRGVVFTDLRKTRETQRALSDSLDELTAICDGMLDGFNIFDLETQRPIRANAALCDMMGYSMEEILALPTEKAHPAEFLPKIEALLPELLAETETRAGDIPLLRSDGSIVYTDVSSRPVIYRGRRCLLTFFHDVTERKQKEEAIRQEREGLSKSVQAHDRDDQRITSQIHDGVAQRIASALFLLQNCRQAEGKHCEQFNAKLNKAKDILRDASEQARIVMNRLHNPVFEKYGLVAAIGDWIAHWNQQDQSPEVHFRHKLAQQSLGVELENTIYRIAQEVISNACLHSQSDRVQIALIQEDHRVTLEVQDWGRGFELSQIDHDRYGIAGISARTRLANGNLDVRTQPDQGTTIHASFPLDLSNDDSA